MSCLNLYTLLCKLEYFLVIFCMHVYVLREVDIEHNDAVLHKSKEGFPSNWFALSEKKNVHHMSLL